MPASPVSALRLLVIGDIAWDILIRPGGGLVWGSDVHGSIDLQPGGSAANVAVWARRLGALVTLVGRVGDDRLGALMRSHLDAEGVGASVITTCGCSTTRIGVFVRPDGEHAFITDHSHPLRLATGDLPPTLLDEADGVFLSGYGVFMAGGAGFAATLLSEARRRGLPVAFDPCSFALASRFGADRLLDELGPLDVIIANEEEIRALTGGAQAEQLLAGARLVVVKQGPLGATAVSADGRISQPAIAVHVVDTTGAGDAFDAAFLVDYLSHGRLDVALAAANLLGARVAGRLGAQATDEA